MVVMSTKGFTVRPYRMKRLSEYCKRMSQDDTHVQFDPNVADVLEKQGFSVEESPRSIYSVEKLYQALSAYEPQNAPNIQVDESVRHGVALAYKCFACPSIEDKLLPLALSPDTIGEITSNPKGSAGLTNYGCTKAKSQVRALERASQILSGEKQPEPCLAFKRTQFNEKTRLVWGYPYSMTVIEGLVAYPLIQEFKRGYTPMAFSMSSMVLGTKLVVSSYHKDYSYSMDMSQFDSSLSRYFIHQSFNILKTWFNLDALVPGTGKTVDEIFQIIEKYFVHTPIVMPDSKLYLGKRHGVPSGSYFTQMVDSIANVIICGCISHKFDLNVDRNDIYVLGDDLLFWSNHRVELSAIANYALHYLGVKVHGDEKSELHERTEPVHYLGRFWDNGIPDIPEDEILKRMIYPERFRKYSDDPIKRQREVRLLILSYASVYRSAWRIATKALDPHRRNVGCGSQPIDALVYGYSSSPRVNPDHLSGLQRYQLKYGQKEYSQTNSATQFWL